MKMAGGFLAGVLALQGWGWAAAKPHTVGFGKWMQIKVSRDDGDGQVQEYKARALMVDGRTKEFTTGAPHEITERIFVIQRVYRLNDSLPQESGAARWTWQLGGWIQVDRSTGKVQPVALGEFDAGWSWVNWFRDYAAYCGISEDGKKAFAVVRELGRRKPLLKKSLDGAEPERHEGCPKPRWERDPARVTFEPRGEAKFTYTVRSHVVDMAKDSDDDSGDE